MIAFCEEIRAYFISTILHSGGHFAGNLGVVELSVALHYVFNFESDRIIWDVGHQAYIHKLLTNRKEALKHIREFNGISGFPKMTESTWDHFGTGHSSTSISAALGMAVAASLKGQNQRKIVAVVGDGALTGGMSFEALNNVISTHPNLLIILNDNHIGIDPNTGAIDRHLQDISSHTENIFTNFGLPYQGPIDGHNLPELIRVFNAAKSVIGPQVLHLKTTKGKGYLPAETEQTRWHSTSRYVKINPPAKPANRKWQDVFADTLIELAQHNSQILGITPAMPSGSGMIKAMEKFPTRFFDVGIAEQHAITFAAGLATEGFIPFVNIYSTFLQRGYDQWIHDVALQKLPVVLCIDRAGLVGEDGPTHHGTFDIAFLRCIPDIIISAPRNEIEFRNLMHTAAKTQIPFCIRYPKGEGFLNQLPSELNTIDAGKAVALKNGKKVAIISTGITSTFALQAAELTKQPAGIFHFPFIKPLDTDCLNQIARDYTNIITIEDGAITGGFGEGIADYMASIAYNGKIKHLGIPDAFITHGDNAILYDICGYSPAKIAAAIDAAFAE